MDIFTPVRSTEAAFGWADPGHQVVSQTTKAVRTQGPRRVAGESFFQGRSAGTAAMGPAALATSTWLA